MKSRHNKPDGVRAPAFMVGALICLLVIVATTAFGSHARNVSSVVRQGGLAHPDIPIPGHTGGFGEPTCQACHFDNDLNDPRGRLVVSGLTDSPDKDAPVFIEVLVAHPELRAAGFQLSIRASDGGNAGRLTPLDDRVIAVEQDGVTYIGHSASGAEPTSVGESAWRFQWQPDSRSAVIVNVAGNAANGDRSEFGDFIYSFEHRIGQK